MASVCGKISAGLTIDCDSPLQAGAEDQLILINRDDWLDAAVTYNGINPQIIEAVVLASGIVAYSYQGKNNSIGPKYEFIKQTFAEVYNHEINFKVFNVDPVAKEQLEKMAKGSLVAIVNNKYKGTTGDSAYEVYGADAGLIVSQNIRDIINQENQGAFDVIIKSDEASLEPHMPKTFFITDLATTKAAVEGLL
jgi:outer membrane lipoprotein SlyB